MKRKEEPLLSVLIPVYNVEQYIENCLESILNQEYTNLEIICVDDGSTDSSGQILNRYSKKDLRVQVIHKENKGLVNTRKVAISVASGEYVTCVDSDDWIEKNMFRDMIDFAVLYDADIVTSGCIREYTQGRSIDGDLFKPGLYEGKKLTEEFKSRMMEKDVGFLQNVKTTIWGKLYKTELLRKYQNQVEDYVNVGEDAAVVYPCLLNAMKIYVSGNNYYHYIIRQSSVSTTKSRKEEKSLKCIEKILEHEFKKNTLVIANSEYQYKAISLFNRLVVNPESVVKIQNNRVFPYDDILKTDRIVIYGAGRYGKKLYKVLSDMGLHIVAIVDRSLSNETTSFETIDEAEYDKILVAVLKSNLIKEIYNYLLSVGVDKEKISMIKSETVMRYFEC